MAVKFRWQSAEEGFDEASEALKGVGYPSLQT